MREIEEVMDEFKKLEDNLVYLEIISQENRRIKERWLATEDELRKEIVLRIEAEK